MAVEFLDDMAVKIRPRLASVVGLNEAVIIGHIYEWTRRNQESDRNVDDAGNAWSYNTLAQWQQNHFPWWSLSTIKRAFRKLERDGILVSKLDQAPNEESLVRYYRLDLRRLGEILRDGPVGQNDPEGQNDPQHVAQDVASCNSSEGQSDPEVRVNLTQGEVKMTRGEGQIGPSNKEQPYQLDHRDTSKPSVPKNGRSARNAQRDRKKSKVKTAPVDDKTSRAKLMPRAQLLRDELQRAQARNGDAAEDESPCVQLLCDRLGAEVVTDSETLELVDLGAQEEQIRSWNQSLPEVEWVQVGPNEWRAKGSKAR